MRALFTAYGSHGHILPLLPLARALVAAGHEVRFAVPHDVAPVVALDGADVVPAGLSDADAVAAARERWPEAASAPASTWTPRMFAEIAAPAMVRDLEPLLSEWRPEVIVREQGEHGAPVAAARAGIPWVTHGWGAPLPDAEGLYGNAVFDPCPASLYEEEPAVIGRHAIRPGGVAPARLDSRLGSGRHAYVGFGTVPLFRHPQAILEAAVDTLIELGFWVTLTVADAVLARRLASKGSQVRVAQWVDLPALLASTDLVVCHGGAGTTLAALANGLPLVFVPQGAPSQERMALACERRGVGRVADGSDLSALRHALCQVATDQRFAAEAAAVGAEIAAMPHAAQAVAVLERLAARSA